MIQRLTQLFRKLVRKDRDFFLCWLLMGLVMHLVGFSLYVGLRQLGLLTFDAPNLFVRTADFVLFYVIWYLVIAVNAFWSWIFLTARLGRIDSWLWVSLLMPLIGAFFDRIVRQDEMPYSLQMLIWLMRLLFISAPYAIALAKYSARTWAYVLSTIIICTLRPVITDAGKSISPLWAMLSYNIAEITLVILGSFVMIWIVQGARVASSGVDETKTTNKFVYESDLQPNVHIGEYI